MSFTKRWIDDQTSKGIDVLHVENTISEEEHCHYSGLPSPAAYQNEEQDENKTRDYSETA